MFVWAIIIILVACIVALTIYYNEKSKSLEKENKRLKKMMISSGYNFEQLEFRLEEIQNIIKKSQQSESLQKIKELLRKANKEVSHILRTINTAHKR